MGKAMTGIYFDSVTGDWAISVAAAGGVCGYAATAQEATAQLEAELARWERYHRAQADTLAAMQGVQQTAQTAAPHAIEAAPAALPVAPVQARQTATEREEPTKPRCSWAAAIRFAFGIAKGAGLDTKADAAMRAAIGAMLGRAVPSRSKLTAGEWLAVGDAIRIGELAW
jgi:hypothetical protein